MPRVIRQGQDWTSTFEVEDGSPGIRPGELVQGLSLLVLQVGGPLEAQAGGRGWRADFRITGDRPDLKNLREALLEMLETFEAAGGRPTGH